MKEEGLCVRNVTFRYEDLLMEFDLSVPRREFVAIIGPSGAGKSTLLNLIAGFEDSPTGSITWQGQEISSLNPAARPLSILFQEHNVFNHLDVWTNVALGISPNLRLSDEQADEVRNSITRVGLGGLERRLPGELSGGERQRVGLARMLVRNRPLLLLDEPFAALGPQLKRDMLALLSTLHLEGGFTILFVTHDPADIALAATHAAFLNHGHILLKRNAKDFFAAPQPQELAAYLGQ